MEVEEKCDNLDGVVIWCGLCLIVLLIFFSFFQKRKQLRLNCCYGVPGLFPPLDFLTGRPSRLLLTLALTALSGHVLQNILLRPVFINDADIILTQIITVFIRIFWVTFATVLFLPIVICSTATVTIIGYVIGAIYSTLLIGYFIIWGYTFQRGCLYFATVVSTDPPELAVTLIGIIPIFLCIVGILLWYIVHIVKEIVLNCKNSKRKWTRPHSTLHVNSYDYTKFLLTPRSTISQSNTYSNSSLNCFKKFLNKIYTNQPGFRYPLRLTVALGGAFIVLYMATFLLIPRFLTFGNNLRNISNDLVDTFGSMCGGNESESSSDNGTQILCRLLDNREVIINGLTYYLIVGLLFPFPISLLQFIPIMKAVRYDLLQGCREKLSKDDIKLPPSLIISSGMKYPGYQIGYLTLAWFMYALVVWLLGIMIIVVVVMFVYAYRTFLISVASTIIAVVVNITIRIVQYVLSKYVFAEKQDKVAANDVVLTNRRSYLIVSYFLYCYNGFLGIFSSVFQFAVGIVQGLVYFPRLDVPASRNQRLNKSYMTYLGFIQFELVQNNRIVHVFIDLLNDSIMNKTTANTVEMAAVLNDDEFVQNGIEVAESFETRSSHSATQMTINSITMYNVLGATWPRFSQRAYNRWHLAKFLLQNPSLVSYRYKTTTTEL